MDIDSDSAKVSFPPPLIFVGTLLLGLALDRVMPWSLELTWIGRYVGGGLLTVVGLAVGVSAMGLFRKFGTDVKPWKTTSAIVADGVYRFTRNPMYLGMAMLYIGFAFALSSLGAILLLPILIVIIRTQVIAREDAISRRSSARNIAPTNCAFAVGFDMEKAQPFVFEPSSEAKRYAPATERNRDAIADILTGTLPSNGLILEIASGTGEHAVHFARRFPQLRWQPSDPDPSALRSIMAWIADSDAGNILPPIEIDACSDWSIDHADAIMCINMVHISPWAATLGLLSNASRILPIGGMLYLYGPYRRRDVPTTASNEEFDRSLKERNSDWGLRYVEDMVANASKVRLAFEQLVEMPANNLSLIFRLASSNVSSPD